MFYFEIRLCKSIIYGIISHDSIKTKQTPTRYDHIQSVYLKLDAYMAFWYVFQPLKSLNQSGVQLKPAMIYHVNATTMQATSETQMAGVEKCEGFYQN